jgi:hypothetical protein
MTHEPTTHSATHSHDEQRRLLEPITKGFDQYEYVAVIIPGATLLFALSIAFPDRFPLTFDKNLSLGALGIFLIAAYVTGHVLRAIGDIAEKGFWWWFGGQPTEWVIENKRKLLDETQRRDLVTAVKTLLGLEINLSDYVPKEKRGEWQAVTRQIYAAVSRAGLSVRVDAFNRSGGMMMGITISLATLAPLFVIRAFSQFWCYAVLFGVLALILGALLFRFYLFGVSYARELYVQFLNLARTNVATS